LYETQAVVEIEFAGSLAVGADGDDELEINFAERGSSGGRRDTLGDDGSAAVVQWDRCGVDVGESNGSASTGDFDVGVEVVKDVLGQVDGY